VALVEVCRFYSTPKANRAARDPSRSVLCFGYEPVRTLAAICPGRSFSGKASKSGEKDQGRPRDPGQRPRTPPGTIRRWKDRRLAIFGRNLQVHAVRSLLGQLLKGLDVRGCERPAINIAPSRLLVLGHVIGRNPGP
jgi:hypothetical protein